MNKQTAHNHFRKVYPEPNFMTPEFCHYLYGSAGSHQYIAEVSKGSSSFSLSDDQPQTLYGLTVIHKGYRGDTWKKTHYSKCYQSEEEAYIAFGKIWNPTGAHPALAGYTSKLH